MTSAPFRERIVERLKRDLVGPFSDDEVLTDRPTQRYSTGILYPCNSQTLPEEDEDGGLAVNEDEDAGTSADTSGVSLHATMKPSVAGLSFAVRPAGETCTRIDVEVRCARYERFAVDEAGQVVAGEPSDRSVERWRRIPLSASLRVEISPGETKVDLGSQGIEGLELYLLVTPHGELLTATAAITNRRSRGDSRVFDEEQHFFQVELTITGVANGAFAPRPSRRAETDEDTRAAALIYRDVREHVVGHTCSARAELDAQGRASCLSTEWIPVVEVPSVSDHGDSVFDRLRGAAEERTLDARWLAEASSAQLVTGLQGLVVAYREWIEGQRQRIDQLPAGLRAQAQKHIDRCTEGAKRMEEGVASIRDDAQTRDAFQLAQNAMRMQFSWSRKGASLTWRPFQLAFQLLVLSSLATGSHPDRDTMDLLWFPTGGGKTEAYLALTAFIILLRRLRGIGSDKGTGVAVLMRYTLRLLTIQQFQRAAAMICACELLRRRSKAGAVGIPDLGTEPIGLGLWVGAAATPLTLREALARQVGQSSSPKQLTACPSCGAELTWKLSPKESTVECPSNGSECEYAAGGARIPVWTIDEEVYANVPSLLIGTVDKFAQVVRKPETRALFGRGARGTSPPDLIIQDELHLISGPLGSIAGLYEVAIDELCRRGNVRPKVIGSTATIRRATDQARSLFDRDTYQFPAPGLDAANSGFAVIERNKPGRLYLGVTTAGRSATYMLQAIAASLLQAANQPVRPEELDFYWSLVVYFNSLRELGRALVLMQDDVPVSVGQIAARRQEAARTVDVPAELTSRVKAYEIRDMLARLLRRAGEPEAVDLLLASNMISVGMDIPRLGMMLVNAQPKSLSEYIQATSRVGRGDVPGIIVTMYNSTRARDRSHYETFETWHQCLYRDVEATSVTPFASRAQDKALHAVLVALVRHLVPGMEKRPALNDIRRVDVERVAAAIEQRVARVDPSERVLVSQKLRKLVDEWANRTDLQAYWDDFGRQTSLLMSAEQFAAKASSDPDLAAEGERRALWPTPNSMREVEAAAPFVLRNLLKSEES